MVACFAPVEKFRDYIFMAGATHGKDHVFRSLGYNQSHSAELAPVYEQQAALKFSQQNFLLRTLDQHGQRINIEIELAGIGEQMGLKSYLISGWMIRGDNSITLNTPFSGLAR
jgi:hypothetical protein